MHINVQDHKPVLKCAVVFPFIGKVTKPDSLKNISVSKNEADSHALPKSAFYLQRDIKIFSKNRKQKKEAIHI